MLSNFAGVESERTVSKYRKKLSEIGKFHVAVVQRMLRKTRYAQAKLLFCCYKKTSCFFAVLVAVALIVKLRLVVILGRVVQSWVKITQGWRKF